MPCDIGYFDTVLSANRLPSDTTLYTQNLLNAETRSDQEFFEIYDGIHKDYADSQGLENCDWLNLDYGFKEKFMLDVGNDGRHPGEQSHCAFAEHLLKCIQKITW